MSTIVTLSLLAGCDRADDATAAPERDRESSIDLAARDLWDESTAPIEITGSEPPAPWTGADLARSLVATTQGYLATATASTGPAVWHSADLASFAPRYEPACCGPGLEPIVDLGDGTLVAGRRAVEDAPESTLLWRSDDGGRSWVPVEGFAPVATWVDSIVVTGGAVVLVAVDDRDPTARRSVVMRSTDLGYWQEVELAGYDGRDYLRLLGEGTLVFAVANIPVEAATDRGGVAVWSSADGGATFRPEANLAYVDLGNFAVVRGSLVRFPSTSQSWYQHADPLGLAVLRPGEPWEYLPADTGSWGDGYVFATTEPALTPTGRRYTLVTRVSRASMHYCYADVATCEQREVALMASEDGREWYDVAGFPRVDGNASRLLVGRDGSITVVTATRGVPELRVIRWIGATEPPLVSRPDYPPPEIPLPLLGDALPLEVGYQVRYPLGLGPCGGMYVNGQRWAAAMPFVDDRPPASWPVLSVGVIDGPDRLLLGRIRLVATDEIEFSIEGVGPVATFRPAPPRPGFCG